MSFGFSVGDFVALSTLTVSLYRSFRNAPGEFSEISRQLQSLHIVIADLSDQAQQENSPLNRNGTSRGQELLTIRGNLLETMRELEDLHKRYRQMGRISWSRFQLGQENLAAMREKLTLQISALNAFIDILAISALGRMEPMLQKIYNLLTDRVRGSVVAAQSVLSAASSHHSDAWATLELDLRAEGIPSEYIQNNRQAIQTVLLDVVESNNLAGDSSDLIAFEDDSICVNDSASQSRGQLKDVGTLGISGQLPSQFIRPSVIGSKGRSGPSKKLSGEDEATRILILNNTGLDVTNMWGNALSELMGRVVTRMPTEAKAMRWAASYGASQEPLKLLHDCGCNPPPPGKGDSAVFAAAKANAWGNVKFLLERGAKFEKYLLHMAAAADEAEIIRLLLALRIPVDALVDIAKVPMTSRRDKDRGWEEWTPLHFAAWNASFYATAILLERGAQINRRTKSITFRASASGLSLSPAPDRPTSALNLALAFPGENSLAMAKLLASRGAEIGAEGCHRREEPLHIASRNADIDAVNFLLNEGANINAVDASHSTPLHEAAAARSGENSLAVATILVKRGADIHAKTSGALLVPLHESARTGNLKVVNYLLRQGADINAKARYGTTPLHRAVIWGHLRTVNALLHQDADIEAQTNYNGHLKTALGIAIRLKDKEIAECLITHGASWKETQRQALYNLGLAPELLQTIEGQSQYMKVEPCK